MSSQEEKYEQRQERLKAWFRSNPSEWDDIVSQLDCTLQNRIDKVLSYGDKERDYNAGYCKGIRECVRLKQEYR